MIVEDILNENFSGFFFYCYLFIIGTSIGIGLSKLIPQMIGIRSPVRSCKYLNQNKTKTKQKISAYFKIYAQKSNLISSTNDANSPYQVPWYSSGLEFNIKLKARCADERLEMRC